MQDISKVDKNFAPPTALKLDNAVFYDVKENPFCLFGIFYADGAYRRMPTAVAEQISEGMVILHDHTSGGRLRFRTDSPYVAISATMSPGGMLSCTPVSGSMSFDLYADGRFVRNFTAPCPLVTNGYEDVKYLPSEGEHEISLYFPLYHDVKELRIGLQKGASFLPIANADTKKRVVFYGSSITQGSCASRPGMAYPNFLAGKFDFTCINLGFSGNAKGEDVMCDYIAALAPDVFVMDYDHNAPDAAHLKATHERFFLRFREKNPQTSVIFLSAPNVRFETSFDPRRPIIRATYENALKRGDKNVYYIDGYDLFGEEDWDSCSVDGCHPNDLGHYRIANCLAPIFKQIFKEN